MPRRKKTKEEFVDQAKKKNGDDFDYSEVEYKGVNIKIIIKCNTCKNKFLQRANSHLQGIGCPHCSRTYNYTNDEWKIEATKKRGNDFDYSETDYKNNYTKILIKCNTCGNKFKQIPNEHLRGTGCPNCSRKYNTNDEWVIEAKKKHGDDFDYSQVDYKNAYTKITIKCNKCNNKFQQTPNSHLQGTGCPRCSSYKSEKICLEYLNEICEYNFVKNRPMFLEGLELDCFCPEMNIALEYQGEQHYKYISHFHRNGEEDFIKQQERDKKKKDLCEKNGIALIIVSYEYNCYNKNKLKQYIKTEYEKIIFSVDFNF